MWLDASNRHAHKNRVFPIQNIYATGWLLVLAGKVGNSMNQESTWSPCGAFVAYTLTTGTWAERHSSSQRATVFIVRPSPIPRPTTFAGSCLSSAFHLLPLPHTCIRLSHPPPSILKTSGCACLLGLSRTAFRRPLSLHPLALRPPIPGVEPACLHAYPLLSLAVLYAF